MARSSGNRPGPRAGSSQKDRRPIPKTAGSRDVPTTLRPLNRSFFSRPVLQVARDCIGQLLVHQTGRSRVVGRIVESEAYRGPQDRAAHSFGGRRTKRTEPMFGPPGHAYVFFVYGMHWNFNLVTSKVGQPHAVLIRAVEPLDGLAAMAKRRGMEATRRQLTNGPGKLCQAFGITGEFTGIDLCKPPLFLAAGEELPIARSPRIGIDYAEDWVDKPWRFYAKNSAYVSRPR